MKLTKRLRKLIVHIIPTIITRFMFKVTPFFPLKSKDKHTITVDNIANDHTYWMKGTGNYFSKNMFLDKPNSDF